MKPLKDSEARSKAPRRGKAPVERAVAWARFKNPNYLAWRNAVLARDKLVCRQCGRKRRAANLVAHHVRSYAKFPARRFDISNGITLCRECHMAVHRKVRCAVKRGRV